MTKAKEFTAHSYNDKITFKPLDSFRTVSVDINDFPEIILDTEDMQQLIDFLELQLRKSKRKGNWNKQRINKKNVKI